MDIGMRDFAVGVHGARGRALPARRFNANIAAARIDRRNRLIGSAAIARADDQRAGRRHGIQGLKKEVQYGELRAVRIATGRPKLR